MKFFIILGVRFTVFKYVHFNLEYIDVDRNVINTKLLNSSYPQFVSNILLVSQFINMLASIFSILILMDIIIKED